MKKTILFLICILFFLTGCVADKSAKPMEYTGKIAEVADDSFEGKLKVHIFKLPYGRAILLSLPTGERILIDCASSEDFPVLYQKLKDLGINVIDTAVLTSLGENYAGGAHKVMENFAVCELYVSENSQNTVEYQYIKNTAEATKTFMHLASEGTRIYDFGMVCVDAVSADGLTSSGELQGLGLYIVGGGKSIFVEGECSLEDEAKMATELKGAIKADILIAPLSQDKESISMYFLKEVSPSYTVIPVGYDKYSSKSLMESFGEVKSCEVLRTDINGDICFFIDGKEVKIKLEG